MIRILAVLALLPLPALAAEELSKEMECRYQGQVAAAVAQARLDRVRKNEVAAHIAATNPAWPARFNKAIPYLVDHFYSLKRRDLRNNDMGALMEAQCLANWDQVQEMKKDLTN